MSLIFALVGVLSATVLVPSVCQREHAGVYVTLYPPMNVSFGYIGDKTAYVYWFPPPVYIHVNFTNTLGDPNEPAPGKTVSDTDVDTDTSDKQKNVPYTFNKDSENTTDSVPNVMDTSTVSAKLDNSTVADLNTTNVNTSSILSENTTSEPSAASVTNSSEQTNTSSSDYKSADHHQNVTIWTPWTPKYIKYNDSQDKQLLPNNDIVRFHDGHLIGYIVTWWQEETAHVIEQRVNSSMTALYLQGLIPNTKYRLNVSAVYIEEKILQSNTTSFITTYDTTKTCECDKYGTLSGNVKCNLTSKVWCTCRSGFGGLFCEHCAVGYYRNALGLPCWKCPCDEDASTGSCHFKEEFLYCDQCKDGYAGNLCHKCVKGFFRLGSSGRCKPCACRGNSDNCNPYTGECIDCKYNTTGFSCDKCQKDYEGDPHIFKNCTHKADLKPRSKTKTAIIALVCVIVVLILSAIAGIIIYRKWKEHPAAKPFWTVELQDDHEGVNFSSLPEDDLQNTHVEDMNFYEKHDKTKSKRGAKKYSPLREDL